MSKKVREELEGIGFRQKVVGLLIVFTLIPSIFIQQVLMRQYEETILSKASEAVYSVVSANNEVLRMMMKQVEDTSWLMLSNEEYYHIFHGLSYSSVSDYMNYDKRIATLLTKAFSAQETVYDSYLYTSRWIFGESSEMSVSGKGIQNSGLLASLDEAGGQPHWFGGYDYGELMNSAYLKEKTEYEYQYPVIMMREMCFQYNDYASYYKLSENEEWPVLFVYILEEDIRKTFEDSVSYEGSMYGIINKEGRIITSDTERFPPTQIIVPEISSHINESGYARCSLDGEEYLFCYDTLEGPEWLSWCLVPMDTLVKDTMQRANRLQMIYLAFFLLLSGLAASFFSKMITKPIGVLIDAAQRVATGDFSANTPVPKEKDFKVLTESFNHMEREIDKLIRENYEIKLREKEAQLMALFRQINPHFLYNTLNTINMLAIRNEDEETSDLIVSLSEMLQYTLRNESEKIILTDEIGWISNYIYIMSRRYEGVFTTDIDIDENIAECLVPKFFLQPFVENAILHGFGGKTAGGKLMIRARREEKRIHFEIEDNGKGMENEDIERYGYAGNGKRGIGVANVYERLRLIYGESFEGKCESEVGKGTVVHLYIPFET